MLSFTRFSSGAAVAAVLGAFSALGVTGCQTAPAPEWPAAGTTGASAQGAPGSGPSRAIVPINPGPLVAAPPTNAPTTPTQEPSMRPSFSTVVATSVTSVLAMTAPAANAAGPISVTATLSNEHVLMPGSGNVHLAIDLRVDELAKGKTRRLPLNLAIVIDRSGSMEGAKIQDTREAARQLVKRLEEQDTFSIVSYSDDVRVDVSATKATPDAKKAALDAISRIHAGGSTNLAGGLMSGQGEVEKQLGTGQVNRVVLMSDGLANVGVTDAKAIAEIGQKASQRGISVSTLGVGTDYNEDVMTRVADRASGNYYFIKDPDRIGTVLNAELDKMASTVAQAAEIEIALDDGVTLGQVFGYTFTEEHGRVRVPLAELFAGQRRSILLEIKAPLMREGKLKLAKVNFKYVDPFADAPAGKNERNVTQAVDVTVTKDAVLVEKTRNRAVEDRVEEVRVATVMTQAADLVKAGKPEEARRLIGGEAMRQEAEGRTRGSGKMAEQAKTLRKLQVDFDDAAAGPPAAAPTLIKAAKQRAYELTK